MTRQFATGLVVGKFAPLHRGHELLIRQALDRCEHVVVISYTNPEFPECPPRRRASWLQSLFPEATCLVLDSDSCDIPANTAPDDMHRHFVADVCVNVLKRRIDAVFTSESYGPGFADVLTRRFTAAGLGASAVAHVAFDPARVRAPISSSALRADLWFHWPMLPTAVARTLVRRIVLLGGESSGKSTLATALATAFQTLAVPEYGRELWEAREGVLAFEDMPTIVQEQQRREQSALQSARRYLFCDTSPLTTLFYSLHLFGRAATSLKEAANGRYDFTILCAPDFGFVQDGTRQGRQFSEDQHAWYKSQLEERGISYLVACGGLEERVASVRNMLQSSGVP